MYTIPLAMWAEKTIYGTSFYIGASPVPRRIPKYDTCTVSPAGLFFNFRLCVKGWQCGMVLVLIELPPKGRKRPRFWFSSPPPNLATNSAGLV